MSQQKLDAYMAVSAEAADGERFYSVDHPGFRLEGLYWRHSGGSFRRLPPSTPERPFSEGVDRFADHSAGVVLRFGTDSGRIRVKVKLRMLNNAADIMCYGRCGFDLYSVGADGRRAFCGIGRLNFDALGFPETEYVATLLDRPDLRGMLRQYEINFPLYAEILDFSVGLDPAAVVVLPPPRRRSGALVYYGTSIQQGCSASRPGFAIGNLLSRKLDCEVLNFGFAGSGKGEPVMAETLGEVENPLAFLLDYDANVTPDQLADTLPGFVDILRRLHPETPIITVSRVLYPVEEALNLPSPATLEERARRTTIHRENLERCRQSGDRRIHFIDGTELYGEEFAECTVDNCHPGDLGLFRAAESLERRLREIL